MALSSGTGPALGFSTLLIAFHPRGETLGESSSPHASETWVPFSIALLWCPTPTPGIGNRPGPPSDLKQPPRAGGRGHVGRVQGCWVLSLQHSQLYAHPVSLRQTDHKSETQHAGATLKQNRSIRLLHSGLHKMKGVSEMRRQAASIYLNPAGWMQIAFSH